jgi:tetratricopeptide (TPR) repeat protein
MLCKLSLAALVITFAIHVTLIILSLNNQFLRYDDLKNFQNVHSLKKIWFHPNESIVLAVWEPVSQSTKLFTSSIFENSRFSHTFVTILVFSITAGLMVHSGAQLTGLYYNKNNNKDDRSSIESTTFTNVHFISVMFFILSAQRVEIIAWASCQSYALALLFSVLFIRSWWMYRFTETYNLMIHLWPIVFYTLAVLSKASAMPLFLIVIMVEAKIYQRNDQTKRPKLLFSHVIVFFILCIAAIFFAIMNVSANETLLENRSHGFAEIEYQKMLYNMFGSTKHYIFNFFSSNSCVHYFFEMGKTNSTQSNDCIVYNHITWFEFLAFLFALSFSIVILLHSRNKLTTIFRGLIFCVEYVVMLSPGLVAGSLGIHGASQGGAAHDRYSLLADGLVAVPALTLFLINLLEVFLNQERINQERTKRNTIILFPIIILVSYSVPKLNTTYKPWKSSLTLWGKALEKNPNDVHALLSLGDVRSVGCSLSTCSLAINYMQRALELDNTKANGWYNYATTLYKAERKIEALNAMQRAIELSPDDVDALDRLLRISVETKNIEIFMKYYQHAIHTYMETNEKEYMEYIVQTAPHLPGENSLRVLNFICLHSPSSSILFLFGSVLHQKKQFKKAISIYQNSLVLDKNADVYHNLGIAFWQNNQKEEANDILVKGIKNFPQDKDMKKTLEMISN